MTERVEFQKIDHVHGRIVTNDYGIYEELSEYFSFRVPGFQFMPAYKSGRWDGIIRLFNKRHKTLLLGLWGEVKKFCKTYDYEFVYEREQPEHTEEEVLEFLRQEECEKLPFPLRDCQWETIPRAILNKRRTIVSPTGSGKSLMIYETAKFLGLKTLLIVPTVGLVHQMVSDFEKYGSDEVPKKIFGGEDKDVADHRVVVSTWQSLTKLKKEWFEQFEVVLVDETHGAKAAEMRKILEKCAQARYRLGFTGTLNDEEHDKLVVTGLLGPMYRSTYTHELIEKGELSEFDVRAIVLKYPQSQRKALSKMKYADEIKYLVENPYRNQVLINIVLRLKRASLVLTRRISQLDVLAEQLKKRTDRPVHVVKGSVLGDERERIRKSVDKEEAPIIVATVDTMSTGVDIPSLKYIVMASPFKAKIKLLQSIGRSLRLSENKTRSIFFDIVDDFSWKKKKNYSYQHFMERVRIYREEKLKFSLFNMEISNGENRVERPTT